MFFPCSDSNTSLTWHLGIHLSFQPDCALWGKQQDYFLFLRQKLRLSDIKWLHRNQEANECLSWSLCSQLSTGRCLSFGSETPGCLGQVRGCWACPGSPVSQVLLPGHSLDSYTILGWVLVFPVSTEWAKAQRGNGIVLYPTARGIGDPAPWFQTQMIFPSPSVLVGHEQGCWLLWFSKYALDRHLQSGGFQISSFKGSQVSPKKRDDVFVAVVRT